PKLGLWYPRDSPFDLDVFYDSDYARASLDRKSTTGGVVGIQNQMLDYGFNFTNTKIYIDNESTICIVKNPVFHSKTKHIEIRHHFIRDSYEKKLIQVIKIHIDNNVADLLTKAFDGTDSGSGLRCQDTILRGAEAQTRESKGEIFRVIDFLALANNEPKTSFYNLYNLVSKFEAASKQSNDLPLSRVTILGSGEDNMKLRELMEFCTKVFERALD
ncbi:hypothetical protein Tco_0805021, partial [Tanacetum coccineum]